jgi:hypothetical protein
MFGSLADRVLKISPVPVVVINPLIHADEDQSAGVAGG